MEKHFHERWSDFNERWSGFNERWSGFNERERVVSMKDGKASRWKMERILMRDGKKFNPAEARARRAKHDMQATRRATENGSSAPAMRAGGMKKVRTAQRAIRTFAAET
jgi:hypothetical protein